MQSIRNQDATSGGSILPMLEKTVCDLSDEKFKLAFRMAYSLFDKIAFFLKKYFRLPVLQQRVNFRTLWYPDGRKANGLQPKLRQSANWPLMGLFWLSKDLYEHNFDFKEGLEAEIRGLIRYIRYTVANPWLEAGWLMERSALPFQLRLV